MIFLDNMTLQGAARVLGATVERLGPDVDRRGDGKWDFEANDRLQIAIDLMCLAHLCHALVFHDRIATTSDFAERWNIDHGAIDVLRDFIEVIPVHEDKRSVFQSHAAVNAAMLASTEEFGRYMQQLGDEPMQGTFLRISNGYFETGYADPGIFEDVHVDHEYFSRAARHVRESTRLRAAAMALPDDDPAKETALRRINWSLAVQHQFLLAEEKLRRYGTGTGRAHPLGWLDFPVRFGTVMEVAGGAEFLVKNLAAAAYYGIVARATGAQYLPHPLRAPFGITPGDELSLDGDLRFDEEAVRRKMEFLRASRAASVNELITTESGSYMACYVDVVFPFVLAAVLEEASSVDDIMRWLLIFRDSKAARRIRQWFGDFRARLEEGDISLSDVESQLRDLNEAIIRWMNGGIPGQAEPRRVTIGLNLGLLALETDVPIRQPRRSIRDFRLIQDLAMISNASMRLDPALRRVFGPAVAEAWADSQVLLQSVRAPGARPVLDQRY